MDLEEEDDDDDGEEDLDYADEEEEEEEEEGMLFYFDCRLCDVSWLCVAWWLLCCDGWTFFAHILFLFIRRCTDYDDDLEIGILDDEEGELDLYLIQHVQFPTILTICNL